MKFGIIALLLAFSTALYISGTTLNIYQIQSGSILTEVTLWEYCQKNTKTSFQTCKTLSGTPTITNCEALDQRYKAARAFGIITSAASSFAFIIAVVRVAADCARRGIPRYLLVFLQIASPLFAIIAFAAAGSIYTQSFCGQADPESVTGSKLGPLLPLFVVAAIANIITVIVECVARGNGERVRKQQADGNDDEKEMQSKQEPTAQ